MKFCFEKYPLPILLISLLFAVKAIYLSFWVTPLWDIPDEFGHYAYVQDIAEGRGLPLLGTARIDADIMRHSKANADQSSAFNWIAQHPPVYYVIAAVPLKIGSCLTSDVEILYRLPRIISAFSGALLLLVLFKTFRVVGVDEVRATIIASSVGFIPMVSHMSSGTNHDISLFLFCALATYFFASYLIKRNLRDAYWCALWLTIAGGTKMTAWVFLAPMIAILLVELPGPIKSYVKHAVGVFILALSGPLAWMLRNIVYFGNPFYIAGSVVKPKLTEPLDNSFFEYLYLQPGEQLMVHFYGLFGWMGRGLGKVSLLRVDGLPLVVFSIIMITLASITALYVCVLIYHAYKSTYNQQLKNSLISWASELVAKKRHRNLLIISAVFFAFVVASYLGTINYVAPSISVSARFFVIVLLIFSGILASALLLFISDPTDRVALYGLVIMLFFGSILLYELYNVYLVRGKLGAMHGRYFYPVTPVLLLSFAIALKRFSVPVLLMGFFAVILVCMELETFLLQVIPFYFDGRL